LAARGGDAWQFQRGARGIGQQDVVRFRPPHHVQCNAVLCQRLHGWKPVGRDLVAGCVHAVDAADAVQAQSGRERDQ
jgi:hypothetical protein